MGERRSFQIKKGLDLPIIGDCEQAIDDTRVVAKVAVTGPDFLDLRPTMAVEEGDRVKLGQLLFEDKKTPGVRYTSPGAGTVSAINRGAKRALMSVVIDLDGEEAEDFGTNSASSREQVVEKLVASGLWTALRTRPFSKIPTPGTVPSSIFVTAIDTNPLAADPSIVLRGQEEHFNRGLEALATVTDGELHLCKARGASIPEGNGVVSVAEFDGPHPAGLPGTHIHLLDPVSASKTVFWLNYQDVVEVGHLFTTGKLAPNRIVALGGPIVKRPRLLSTRRGACISDLVAGELEDGENRVVSGSVLSGRTASGALDFLGQYHIQVSALAEGTEREFLGWQMPGFEKFSVKNVFASKMSRHKRFNFTTSTEGSVRAMVPVGSYESIMPLDILPTFLLRALIVGDSEQAQLLGCLELDEEDLGLCTFVCPGKTEYGPLLRSNLDIIEREG